MKKNISLYLLVSILFFACNTGPKHPQALADSSHIENEPSILAFADSIDAARGLAEHQSSIIYQTAQNSFYIDKFSLNGRPASYTEHSVTPGIAERTSSYYFKNDSLVLVRDHIKRTKEPVTVFEEKRSYLRNGVTFKTEKRLATSDAQLRKAAFKEIKNPETVDYRAAISDLDDALSGSNKFEMVFEELITAADGQFISLKSKLPGSYSSSVRLTVPDDFTDSLQRFPELFKNTKLSLRTEIKDNESVYVPVARRVTSASGLNR